MRSLTALEWRTQPCRCGALGLAEQRLFECTTEAELIRTRIDVLTVSLLGSAIVAGAAVVLAVLAALPAARRINRMAVAAALRLE